MCHCIINSITKLAIKELSDQKDNYTINRYISDNILFKILVCESSLDIKIIIIHIYQYLANLPKYMSKISNNTLKFNTYAKSLMNSLH